MNTNFCIHILDELREIDEAHSGNRPAGLFIVMGSEAISLFNKHSKVLREQHSFSLTVGSELKTAHIFTNPLFGSGLWAILDSDVMYAEGNVVSRN